jgi:predicted GNAT family acetyltransferase
LRQYAAPFSGRFLTPRLPEKSGGRFTFTALTQGDIDMSNTDEKNGRITLGLITSWGLGCLFLIAGAASVADPKTSGVVAPFLLIAVLLLPPIRRFVNQKTGKSISTGVRVICVLILMGFGAAAMPQTSSFGDGIHSQASAPSPISNPESSESTYSKSKTPLKADETKVSKSLGGIYEKVANDAVDQYQIAKRGGSVIDICVQAGFVSAAYLQAKDEANYQKWKEIEKVDCAAAGVPY